MNTTQQSRVDTGIMVTLCAILGAIVARFELVEHRHDRKRFTKMVCCPSYKGTTGKFVCETCGRSADGLFGHKRDCAGRKDWFGSCRLIIGPDLLYQVRHAGGRYLPNNIDAPGSASNLTTREIATHLPKVIELARFGEVGQAQLLAIAPHTLLPQLSESDLRWLDHCIGGFYHMLDDALVRMEA